MIWFRNDDINPSTDLEALHELYEGIVRIFPSSRIISGVTLFGAWNPVGAVYPDLPIKTKTNKYLYITNRFLHRHSHVIGDIASHGLFHVNHAKISRDAQEMSIVGSCNFLGTKKFIAPFNEYNPITEEICHDNKIELTNKFYDWRSLEFCKFDPNHLYWYWHSWKTPTKKLLEMLSANSKVMGLV